MNTVIVIPVRMKSSRLPGKPLADINGFPMMIHVGNRAKESKIGEVIFACAEQELVDLANKNGFEAILTDPAIPNGTDRCYLALKKLKSGFDYIINLQGDLPFVKPSTIASVYKDLVAGKADIATAASIIGSKSDIDNPSMVKVAISQKGYALYFTRTPQFPYGDGLYYKHIGIYGYTKSSLEKYINLSPSPLEIRESLEQLRALENDMKISVAIVEDEPLSVDTYEDLALIKKIEKILI